MTSTTAMPRGRRRRDLGEAAKGERRYTCEKDDCGRSFTRAEHLQRHLLNHTTGAFTCERCRAHFKRKDLLGRLADFFELYSIPVPVVVNTHSLRPHIQLISKVDNIRVSHYRFHLLKSHLSTYRSSHGNVKLAVNEMPSQTGTWLVIAKRMKKSASKVAVF